MSNTGGAFREFDDPEKFVDCLYRRNEIWRPNPNEWIFRGHGNTTWPLLPTAFRPTAVLVDQHTSKISRGVRPTVHEQKLAEFNTFHRFLHRCNDNALSFASDDDSVFDFRYMHDNANDTIWNWPPPRMRPNLGLAQHYGISTRLLDWTSSASVAAYFAARSAAERWHTRRAVEADGFCIWALRPTPLESTISVVRVPRASNPNLHAQSGLFTLCDFYDQARDFGSDDPFGFNYPFSPLTFDTVVANACSASIDIDPVLVKLSAPLSLAPAVLRILNDIGMNASAIYPGYKGAADAVVEQEFWD